MLVVHVGVFLEPKVSLEQTSALLIRIVSEVKIKFVTEFADHVHTLSCAGTIFTLQTISFVCVQINLAVQVLQKSFRTLTYKLLTQSSDIVVAKCNTTKEL